jgi:hypothetical protein
MPNFFIRNRCRLLLVRRFLLFFCALASFGSVAAADAITVNGQALSQAEQENLHKRLGAKPLPGSWWYDATSGAFGSEGGATAGFLPAGLNLGGRLRADASGGGDGRHGGVFINGRELHPVDVQGLVILIGQVVPGRYWVKANGDFGYEGGGALGNLWQLAASNQGTSQTNPRSSQASGCTNAWCRNSRSWQGSGYFSDGKSGCIVMEGEISC